MLNFLVGDSFVGVTRRLLSVQSLGPNEGVAHRVHYHVLHLIFDRLCGLLTGGNGIGFVNVFIKHARVVVIKSISK